MKKFKKIAVVSLIVLALAATSFTAFAYTFSSPAEILANLTGKNADDVAAERYESGLTYGQMAYEEGLWEEYNDEMLKNKKAYLDEKVTEGTITQEEADEIYANIEARQEACLGNGTGGFGGGMMGLGFGGGGRNWQ